MSISSPPGDVVAPAVAAPGHVLLAPGATAKIRDPIVVAILSFVTLGIYMIFWWYYINREMADYGRARGTKELGDAPGTSTLALFPGGLVVVPAVWTAVTTFQRVQAAQRLHGQTLLNGWLAFVLILVFSPAFAGYMQSGLNSTWEAAGSGAELQPAAG
jgi:Domain of unknown function (DUF4234)